ncbi:hypothetical protein IWW36_004270 [Coemansia brasiliensis]|uniref:Mitochondrial import inner membrane translocase subunit TIM50 n=1 Tax=Coemansia brasiliensis TaxID=2650707 RepID=A0A9W8I628_9FUNG|nr:hypothetical protein IWW36_004270 [Coemansia brasiliensis]
MLTSQRLLIVFIDNSSTLPQKKRPKYTPPCKRRKLAANGRKCVYLVPQDRVWKDEWFHIKFEENERNCAHKELLVLDLNGTLVWRGPRKKNKSRDGYPRPFLNEFLKFAVDNFAVMVWSSAQPASIADMLNKMLSPYHKQFIRVWDRRFCDIEGEYFAKSRTVKDLERIFNGFSLADSPNFNVYGTYNGYTGMCSDAKGKWTIENTVIVDDSASKTALQKDNHIFISPFKDPLRTNPDGSPADNQLLKLKEYLEGYTAHKEQYPALLDYLKTHPWLEFCNSVQVHSE